MVGRLTLVCQKRLGGECWLMMHFESEEVEELCKEAFSKLRGALIGSLILFLYSFIFWPGFGSTIFWSPLDIFLPENYPLWFIFIVSFFIGFLREFLPAWFGVHHYLYKTYVMEIRGNKTGKYYLMMFISASITIFPAWILIVTQILKVINVFRYNFLEYILMYLAWLKGYKGPYYRGYIGNIFGGFMFSGVFSSIAIIFLQQWLKLKDISKNLNILIKA